MDQNVLYYLDECMLMGILTLPCDGTDYESAAVLKCA